MRIWGIISSETGFPGLHSHDSLLLHSLVSSSLSSKPTNIFQSQWSTVTKETFKRKPQDQIKHEKTTIFYIYIPFGEILFSMAIFLETKQELMIEREGLFLRAREHKRRQITVFQEGQSWLDFASRGKSWSIWFSVFGGRLIFFFFGGEDVWTQSDTCCLPWYPE